jgi:hypothetical protein
MREMKLSLRLRISLILLESSRGPQPPVGSASGSVQVWSQLREQVPTPVRSGAPAPVRPEVPGLGYEEAR